MFTTDPHNKPQIIKRSELIVNLIMEITIATIVIGLKNSYFLFSHLSSCNSLLSDSAISESLSKL